MPVHVHELHAIAVHAPLGLLPTAAAVDLAAALSDDPRRARLGAWLWWGAAGGGALAGFAGLAASQEVRADDPVADDRMWLHGATNTMVLTAILGMAAWRARHAPTRASVVTGMATVVLSMAGAYLGGELVYTHGLGVKAIPEEATGGVSWSPRVLSRQALPALARDAVRGLGWLLHRAALVFRGGRAAMHTDRPPPAPLWAGDEATAI